MSSRESRPVFKVAIVVIIALAALLLLLSVRCIFGGGPDPDPDPDVQAGKLVRLTHTHATELNPVWSPRGDKIAYECMSDDMDGFWPFSSYPSPVNNYEVRNRQISIGTTQSGGVDNENLPLTSSVLFGNICVINADGSGRIKLTDDWNDNLSPAWSPDGSKLAFASRANLSSGRHLSSSRHIIVINSDGSGRVRLTSGEGHNHFPAWSPDGKMIAFVSGIYPTQNIYTMNADGSDVRQITWDVFDAYRPTWSPDGSRIAFTSFRDVREDVSIFVVEPDGSNLTRIPDKTGRHYAPTWSPDGSRIAYVTHSDGDMWPSLYLANPDGSERTLLYRHRQGVRGLDWSPDGNRIAFRWVSHNSDIGVINIDGSGLTRLTNRNGNDGSPSWNPDGTKLAFESRLVGNYELYVIPYR